MKFYTYKCKYCDAEKISFSIRKTEFVCRECSKQRFIKRKSIPEHIKWSVWERDNFTCLSCGTRRSLTIDHIFPVALGGLNDISNLQTLCKSCNSSKGKSIVPDDDIDTMGMSSDEMMGVE